MVVVVCYIEVVSVVVQYYCHYYHTTTRAGGAIGALLRPLPVGHDPLHLHPRSVLGARDYRKGARDHPMLRPRLQGVCDLQPYDERLQPYDERLQPQRAVGLQLSLSLYDERRAAASLYAVSCRPMCAPYTWLPGGVSHVTSSLGVTPCASVRASRQCSSRWPCRYKYTYRATLPK